MYSDVYRVSPGRIPCQEKLLLLNAVALTVVTLVYWNSCYSIYLVFISVGNYSTPEYVLIGSDFLIQNPTCTFSVVFGCIKFQSFTSDS